MKTGPNRSRPADTPLESSTAAHVLASDTPVEVSVVIPCLNEARTVGACIKKAQAAFQEAGLAGEVVVADNGSTDGSAGIAEQLGARVVYAPVRGYGSALRKGIEEARGAFVIMGDADGSHDFSEIPRFVEQGRKGYQLVLGNRFRGNIKPGAMSWHHKYIGNPVLTAILNLFFGAGIGDVYCGMRGFSPELYRRLDLPGGWLMACGLGVILWLLPGPECLGPACFDSRTMLFGTLLALLGFHIISIGLFAKLFSFTEGLSGNQPTLEKWLKRVKLEHGLAFGTILTVVGFAGDVSIFWQWASAGFGQLPSIRGAVYWSLCLFLGIEIIFSSFFLSMLGISRGTYIGDRETS
jgi:glycosyltransferase involved in cell wall biosynthesis